MFLKKEVFLIVGIAKSGLACGKFLLSKKAKCYFYEENKEIVENNLKIIRELGGEIVEKDKLDSILELITVLVLSPGVPIDNYIAKKAKSLNKRIIGELELGAEYLSSPIIAVTGTNGKTTTTYMLEHIINTSGIPSYAVGNVGVPITTMINSVTEDSVLVAEVSSFQLETCNRLLPHISVILNITPDHLDRHYTMENYVYLKGKILNNLRESEYAVLNYDDEIVKGFAGKTRAKVVYFSLKEKINGAYFKDGTLYFNNQEIINQEELPLKGSHNLSNVLACIAVCKTLGITDSNIKYGLTTFKGAKHRLEFVKEIKGISFYNDSKSTNLDSTIKAVESMEKDTILLLGGKDKNLDYNILFNEIKNKKVTQIILFGESRFKMINCAVNQDFTNLHLTKNLKEAILLAYNLAKKDNNVLLSPACSSYDAYSGYEERGEDFVNVVNSLT